LAAYNNHNRQISVPRPEFEPTIPVSERSQTQPLDREAIGIVYRELIISNLYCLARDNFTLRSSKFMCRIYNKTETEFGIKPGGVDFFM